MSKQFKIAFYITLVLIASISGYFALTNFGRMMDRAANRTSDLEQIEPPERKPAEESAPVVPEPATNTTTSAGDTNASSLTIGTNESAATNSTTATSPPPVAENSALASPAASSKPSAGVGSRIGLWTALFIVSIIGLGFLIASDISHFFGTRALKTLYNDEGEGVKNPDYEEAEQVWANGKHLEAIGLMRDYLRKNPREQHVAMRIAEIYEKDLGNHLAAALEYEEVLKHKLPPDRWGWAAIHLCNLYFKLNQEQKGYDLLRRLVKEHPDTPAAQKARKRLEQVEGGSIEQLATESNVETAPERTAPAAPAGPPSNLPPGFRPKK